MLRVKYLSEMEKIEYLNLWIGFKRAVEGRTMVWEKLDECWKEVFRQSWESYKNGTIPVGAVILNEKNEIVSKGRNVGYDSKCNHILAGTAMGHAEMLALMQLKKEEHPNIEKYKLFVSLEPCPMCFGSIMMTGIKDVFFAATDGTAGSSVLQDITEYIESRGVRVTKESGDMEVVQIVLQTSRGKFTPVRKSIETWEGEHRGVVSFGNKLHDENYFKIAIDNNIDISEIYNGILKRYYSESLQNAYSNVASI